MASPAPWLRWTQTELTRWDGEEEEEEDDFERRMDEDGVIGLGEDAGSPPWGDGEDLEEGSPAQEGHWHPRQHPEEEEQGSSGEEEEPWGAESDGDAYPELSYEGRWGSGSSGSPEVLRDGQGLCRPRGCSTDGGDTSGLSDTSPGPTTPSRWHRGWGTAGDTGGGSGQDWTPSQSLLLHLSTDDLGDATSTEPVPKPQPAGTGLPSPGTVGLTPTGQPWDAGTPPAPRVLKTAAPAVPPPKPAWHSRSPRQRPAGGRETRDPSGSGTSAADGTQYGRGQLNHPLPDLSKVEARVKFGQSYRPPRGRALPPCPSTPRGPITFKSPAEIVREVLLSSGEGVSPQPPAATGLPQEFSSPKQATELVQQLQDDYHKLLTKYAEAENTIDQLRLGARVSLYADPPRPSRSVTVGSVGTGCRVMALSIPRASAATLSSTPAPPALPGGAPALALQDKRGSPQPPSPPPPGGRCPTCPGPQLTQRLEGQTHKLQAQVEAFEGWIRAGTPEPREQLQRFRKLKDAQDALERAYLGARQQHPGASGDFDPHREVEGEIFRLGLRLEELKERLDPGAGRLERGAGRQLPPQRPAQPRSPPAPSPPPARSPRPESPALMEGPRGAAGGSEGAARRLPRPLWRKQLRAEEDFGDLLAQYKRFKSLPESLSLEQLSLAESGSQEEVDGPTAEDSGPSKVPCTSRSLEEGADLETSPLHPPARRSAPLPPGEPSLPGDALGHLSLATAEEVPATAKPPLGLPDPPRAPQSHCSSGVGSAATQHRPRNEQRIVSPETDSGFVGSESSRVSPPVHTPEHRPPSTGTPGSLGPSILVPSTLHPSQKKEATPLPSPPVLMGTYPSVGQGSTRGLHLPPSTPSHSNSPHCWAESVGSEAGANGDSAHTDSEAEGSSCASASSHPPAPARDPASPPPSPDTPSPTPLSPDLPSLDPTHCDLLGSRLERDQAIQALQDEVWRLRQRLEETLLRSRSYPEGTAAPRATPARRPAMASGTVKDTAPPRDPIPLVRGRAAPRVTPMRRGRSESLPQDRLELDLSKEPPQGGDSGDALLPTPFPKRSRGLQGLWDHGAGPGDPVGPSSTQPRARSCPEAPHPPLPSASRTDPSPAVPQPTPSPQKSPLGAVTRRGHYTGTRYEAVTPRVAAAPQEEAGTPGCSRCGGSRTRLGDAARQPRHSTPRRTRCPTCQAPMGAPEPSSRDGAAHAECGPSATAPPDPRVGPQAQKLEQQPGLWYLAGSPGAPTAVSCLAPVPLVPYLPSMLYCSPAIPTSAPALAGVPPFQHAARHGQAEQPPRLRAAGPHGCLALGLEELEELNRTLSRAVDAAQSMRVTTTRMSRALAAELSRARDLRGSCLF